MKMTVEWYRLYYQNKTHSMRDFTITQIEAYIEAAKLQGIAWASDD